MSGKGPRAALRNNIRSYQDIQRYLSSEPVLAGPPTAGYRLKKYVRRNRVAVLFVSALVVGVAIIAWQTVNAFSASAERDKAEAEKRDIYRLYVNEKKFPMANEFTDWSSVKGAGGLNDRARDINIQADGKILVVGVLPKSCGQSSQDMLVARYNPEGSIDTSFNGIGYNTADFGEKSRDIATNMAIQADGKVLVAGHGMDYSGGLGLFDRPVHLIVARFRTDGTLDSAQFDGHKFHSMGASDVLELASGKILVLSSAKKKIGSHNDVMLVQLNSDLSLDASYGENGFVVHDYLCQGNSGWEMAEQSDGKIVVVGGTNPGVPYFARFNTDGSIDATYAENGEGTIDIGGKSKCKFGNVLIDKSDNSCYVAGMVDAAGDRNAQERLIVKLDSRGSLDRGFGDDGIFRYNLAPSAVKARSAVGIAMDNQGRFIIIGGSSFTRVTADGKVDLKFGYQGSIVLEGSHGLCSVAIDENNSPVAVGTSISGDGGGLDISLIRIRPH